MRTFETLLSYAAGIAALTGVAIMGTHLIAPVAATAPQGTATQQAAEPTLSSSPRIAAWQERLAEEKLYAERAATRDAEEKAKWAALSKPPITAAVADEPRSRELDERALRAQRAAMLRAQDYYAQQRDPFAYAPTMAAPARQRQYNYVFSTMRDIRGGN